MRILVTGASGFLGQHVVRAALDGGHEVHALVRPATARSDLDWRDHPSVSFFAADLRAPSDLTRALAGVDTVVHLAAAKTGTLYDQLAATLVGTENLLDAMEDAGNARLVLISTFSVYDYLRQWSYSRLDEASRLEDRFFDRETYATAKILQERLVRERFAQRLGDLAVLRPGVIYGPGNLWTDQLGIRVGDRLWVRMGYLSTAPVTYVLNCAEAIIRVAETPTAYGNTFNIVDDHLPSRWRYARELRRRLPRKPLVVPCSAWLMRTLARTAWIVNRVILRGRAKMPWFLVPAKLHVQCKPLRFTNRRLRDLVDWSPRYSYEEALRGIDSRMEQDAESSPHAQSDDAAGASQDTDGPSRQRG